MKTKKINTKLSLSKRTVANLNGGEMKGAKGGYNTNSVCPICPTDDCTYTCNCTNTCVTCNLCTNTCAGCYETDSVCEFCTNTLVC